MLEKFGINNLKCSENTYGSPRISSEFMDCSLPLTFDIYNFCSFGCQYCFSLYQKILNPANSGKVQLKSIDYKRFIEVLEGKHPNNPYYCNFLKHRFPLHIGGLADNFCYIEKENKIGLKVLTKLAELNYPTIISTKGVMMVEDEEYYELFKKYAHQKNFAFQFSIITNEENSAKIIELGVPSVERRISAMKKLSDLGYWTILRLRPYIIGISNVNIETLFKKCKEAGVKALSTEFFCVEVKILDLLKDNMKTISELAGYDVKSFYESLSPSKRGGYLRLNRNIKEKYVKEMYKLCNELNIQFNTSDPDFKELNQSGSCCGLPENREKYDSDLVNFSHAQLTYVLKELRRRYYKSGGIDKLLRYEDVMKLDINKWMEEKKYYKDSIKCWVSDYTKKGMNHKKEFQDTWNNLNSAANPYNYFHGVLKPSHIENGNLVFMYSPKEYEKKWMEEGILK